MGNFLCLDVASTTRFIRDYIMSSTDDTDTTIQFTDLTTSLPVPELTVSQPQLDSCGDRDLAEAQRQCQEILRELFPQYRFSRCCPPFLVNPESSNRLDLELYCPNLGIAVEYHGRHHFMYDPTVHRSINDFHLTQLCDTLKKNLCERHDVNLVIVPYFTPNIRDYLTDTFKRCR
jgi:hypothetical protein